MAFTFTERSLDLHNKVYCNAIARLELAPYIER